VLMKSPARRTLSPRHAVCGVLSSPERTHEFLVMSY
jgi:hypothetical protein